jgi:hypothetical protein
MTDLTGGDMTHFENDALGVSFDLPERITVGDQLRYKGRIYTAGMVSEDIYIRYWAGARGMIKNWQCEAMPDVMVNIEDEEDPTVADIVFWAGNMVAGHVTNLASVKKNS